MRVNASRLRALKRVCRAIARTRLAGGTYFFTVNLQDRGKRLLVEHVDTLRWAFAEIQRVMPFQMDGVVVLPDHLHCIWTLPLDDDDFAGRWRDLKGAFSRRVAAGERIRGSRVARRARAIWQRRFWEHAIRSDRDFAAHLDYIHFNPVKHGHAERVSEWPYSSFHKYVRLGAYPANWACGDEAVSPFGERSS